MHYVHANRMDSVSDEDLISDEAVIKEFVMKVLESPKESKLLANHHSKKYSGYEQGAAIKSYLADLKAYRKTLQSEDKELDDVIQSARICP